jgi:hypothetical protein
MKLRNTVLIVAAVAMAATIQTAQAQVTLGYLAAHSGSAAGTLTIADKTYSDFTVAAPNDPNGTLLTMADALTMSTFIGGGVNGGVPGAEYLEYNGFVGLINGTGSAQYGDLTVGYTVTVNTPGYTINMIDQNYTPNASQATLGDNVIIGETVANGGNVVANSSLTLIPQDFSDPVAESGDNLYINPGVPSLVVTKDISFYANPGQIIGLSVLEQSVHQVPEPTTMLAGALLLLPFGASTLRILRRNRMS